jgi:hypothetical protein
MSPHSGVKKGATGYARGAPLVPEGTKKIGPMAIENWFLLALAATREQQLLNADPLTSQKKLLLRLVKRSAQTAFGKAHDFTSIRTSRDFLERVSPKSYNDFKTNIEAIIAGEQNVLFPGKPECFGMTSGTDGIPKLIPLNRALLRSTRSGAFDAALLGGLLHGSLSWRRGKTLYIGPRKGQPLGKWTAYAEGTPFAYLQPFRSRFVPAYEDLPEREDTPNFTWFADLVRRHRVTVIAGNPIEIGAFVLATGIVLPDVQIVFNCGYWAMDHAHLYKSAFPNATVVDVYGSNEGSYGLPRSAGVFLLNYRRVFFTFLPIDKEDQIEELGSVALNQKYRLCVTTPGGLWNYRTGDVVSFISLRPPVIRFHGRDSRSLALEDDWLTEDEIVCAVRKSGIRSLRYFLTPECDSKQNRRGYILCIEGETADAEVVDRHLCELNSTYARLRASAHLGPLTVCQTSITTPVRAKPARIKKSI